MVWENYENSVYLCVTNSLPNSYKLTSNTNPIKRNISMKITDDLTHIRDLLMEKFNDEDLRCLCYDLPGFNFIYGQLIADIDKDQLINQILDHADHQSKLEVFLELAEQSNLVASPDTADDDHKEKQPAPTSPGKRLNDIRHTPISDSMSAQTNTPSKSISNSKYNSTSNLTPTEIIQIQLPGENPPLSEKKHNALVTAIAKICGLSSNQVQLVQLKPDGAWVALEIPKDKTKKLIRANQKALSPLSPPPGSLFGPGC